MATITDQVGRLLGGRYRLEAGIGTGTSAYVYAATDVVLQRRVAVKVLQPGLGSDEGFMRRFRAEAQASAALVHPHVLRVLDWGEDEDGAFLVLEHLAGGSLRDLLDAGFRLDHAQAARLGAEAAHGLAYAHRRGLVHRDVKPANLMLDEDGHVRVADFGLARALADAAWTEPLGAVLGTARYASPEQAEGRCLDDRSDVYSLALVLYEALVGRVPFAGDTTIATLMARVGAPLPRASELGPLAPILAQAAIPEPLARLDAAELAVELELLRRSLRPAAPLPLPLPPARLAPARLPRSSRDGAERSRGSGVLPPAARSAGGAAFDQDLAPAGAPGPGLRSSEPDPGPDHGFDLPAGPDPELDLDVELDSYPDLDVELDPYPDPDQYRDPDPDPDPDPDVDLDAYAGRHGGGPAGGAPTVPGDHPASTPRRRRSGRSRRRPRRRAARIVVTAVAVTATVAVATVAYQLLVVDGHRVPALRDDTLATARSAAAGRGLVVRVGGGRYSSSVAAGSVLGQSPAAGARVHGGSVITLELSRGHAPVALPAGVVGSGGATAVRRLRGAHLVVHISRSFDESVPAGRVLRLIPPSGSVAFGSSVQLVLSRGPAPRTIPAIPAGAGWVATETALDALGLRPHERLAWSETYVAGEVLSVSPAPGTIKVPDGSAVLVVVSRGPTPRTIPALPSATSWAQAAASLTALRLRPVQLQSYSDTVAYGDVVSLSPAPGTTGVAVGSPVEVVVSRGPLLVAVPAVAGEPIAQAVAAIQAQGLVVSEQIGPPFASKATTTDPAPGTDVRPGSSVTLYVA